MKKISISYQGVRGAYSERAAREFFGRRTTVIPCEDFEAVFRNVRAGKTGFGVLPVENSLTGSIHKNFDLLIRHKVWICGEVKLRVSHSLLALPGATRHSIRKILSHPQALGQCEGYLRKLKKTEAVPYFDTAGSARFVAGEGDPSLAAIASTEAGKVYGIKPLATAIEDKPHNFTRFIIISRDETSGPKTRRKTGKGKTSVVFALKNIPGALYKALSIFAIRDIDLLKIESRPIHGSPWTYMFYLDLSGWHDDERCARAIEHLREITEYLQVLGSCNQADS
jgi:prephenate dehydratase